MRKVVDSNFLQDQCLRKYLMASESNIAILTDYIALEMHKENTLKSLSRSMDILSDFPKQVVILKD